MQLSPDMQAVDFNGGRSRTRTYDLSHVRLCHSAKVKQNLQEYPKKTTSSTSESLPSFISFRQHHTDKVRYSGLIARIRFLLTLLTEIVRTAFNFSLETSRSARMKCECSALNSFAAYVFFSLSAYCPCEVSTMKTRQARQRHDRSFQQGDKLLIDHR